MRDATGMQIRCAERFVCIQNEGNSKKLDSITSRGGSCLLLPIIISVIKSRSIVWVRHIVRMGETRNTHAIFVGKT